MLGLRQTVSVYLEFRWGKDLCCGESEVMWKLDVTQQARATGIMGLILNWKIADQEKEGGILREMCSYSIGHCRQCLLSSAVTAWETAGSAS
jgi:hypothetical protein